MDSRAGARGATLVIATLVLLAAIGVVLAVELAAFAGTAQRDRVSDRALAQAREALIAYAADRPITASVGPGYLPCPDLDNDGWAEATCGSQNGDSGQAERLGRLPWKTLGLPDLRDGYGERLWYAVSSKYKGLLNCAVSRACLDMTPDAALGTISVRDPSGTLIHDGTLTEAHRASQGGALAVVIAAGPALARIDAAGAEGAWQARECRPGECDAAGRCILEPPQRAARCNPANYLDKAPGERFASEDNADFVDRNDAPGRARNRNGFIHGPVVLADGRLAVNDRLAVIAYRDVMPRIMARVALEVAHCLRFYASRPENGGRYPWPAPACLQADADPALAWQGHRGVFFGRVADTPFGASPMLERWWRASARDPENLAELPTQDGACRIARAPGDAGAQRSLPAGVPASEGETAGGEENSWWTSWKPFVFYAVAPGFAPSALASPSCTEGAACLELLEPSGRVLGTGKQFAVLVAGPALERDGWVQMRAGAHISEVRQWLEETNARLEGSAGCAGRTPGLACEGLGTCSRVTSGAASRSFNDVVVAYP